MGSSREIAIGPEAVVSLLLGTLLSNEMDLVTHAAEYHGLAFTTTIFTGITQATLGIFRLGVLIYLLSHAAIIGFMGGASITNCPMDILKGEKEGSPKWLFFTRRMFFELMGRCLIEKMSKEIKCELCQSVLYSGPRPIPRNLRFTYNHSPNICATNFFGLNGPISSEQSK